MIEQRTAKFISRMLTGMILVAVTGIVGIVTGLVINDKLVSHAALLLMAMGEIVFGGAIVIVCWIDWRRTLRGRRC